MLKRIVAPLVRRVWESNLYARALFTLDRLAAKRAGKAGDASAKRVLFVAPDGGGNIGDQAMFDAFLERAEGPVDVVVRSTSAFVFSQKDHPDVTLHALPNAIHGYPWARRRDIAEYATLLQTAVEVFLPGADTFDGGNAHSSLGRHSLVRIAVRAGVPAAVQGFSWSTKAPKNVTRSAVELSRRVRLLPRDPASFRRLEAAGARVTQSADIVFTSDTTSDLDPRIAEFLAGAKARGRKVAILNCSGLVAKSVDLTADYGRVIERLHDLGYDVLLLPHVIRPQDSDLTVCRSVFSAYGAHTDFLVDWLLEPRHVRTLARTASVVVTGRMHLAIISLSSNTPVFTMATVGKVEGLYEFFGLPELVIQPQQGCAEQIIAGLEAHESEPAAARDAIAAALSTVRDLALRNFDVK